MANLPNLYLWAWERPEDFQFLGDKKVGVAFLAKTIYLASPHSGSGSANLDAVNIRPRLQPLRIVPGAPLMAVVRMESLRGALPGAYANASSPPSSFSSDEITHIAQEIVASAQIAGVSALQIDFDATLSEHAFYRDLLIEVRKQLPPDFPLSITALASWCIGDRWLADLPPGTIDEAVPMLFRMGTGSLEVTHYLSAGNDFPVPACSTSLGLSTDEPFSRDILSGKLSLSNAPLSSLRIYVFSPRSWEKVSANKSLKDIPSWHEN
ncbi:MAG: hypothetical protein NVS9B14_05560 [Candidatus Acidiferrum sp.]